MSAAKVLKCFVPIYASWGFYKGITGRSPFFTNSVPEYYTDRVLLGSVNYVMHIGMFPIAFYHDIKQIEAYFRRL